MREVKDFKICSRNTQYITAILHKIFFLTIFNYFIVLSLCSPTYWTLKRQWCWLIEVTRPVFYGFRCIRRFVRLCAFVFCFVFYSDDAWIICLFCGNGLQITRDLTFETLMCTYLRSKNRQLLFLHSWLLTQDFWLLQ